MSDYEKHLYVIMHPNRALVASQLKPEDFGRAYSVGTKRYYQGKIIFAKVDPEFRNDYFPIDEYLEKTVPHEDGSPKRTKIISSYRVLEHLDMDAIGELYAVTGSGQTLKLEAAEYDSASESSAKGQVHLIQEINPLQLLVATTMDHKSFGAHLTSAGNPKGAPKLFYTQLDLDVDGFLAGWEKNPFLPTPVPGVHPQKLADALQFLKTSEEYRVVTLGLSSVFDKVLYRNLKRGFFLSEGEKLKYYPFPSIDELQKNHYGWYRSVDQGQM